ncbi:MAG: Dabb family protein, partial [Oscillospiraceae bacterium]|nr:Dabb family protein [Oscillospiraceae bacterium]
MIRHIVMFKFIDNADGKTAMENAAEAKVRALALKEQISEIKKIEVQLNSKAADTSNYEFALICYFESI